MEFQDRNQLILKLNLVFVLTFFFFTLIFFVLSLSTTLTDFSSAITTLNKVNRAIYTRKNKTRLT